MTVLPDEPKLDVEDIQGHVFPGFGSAYTAVMGFRPTDPERGRAAAAKLLPHLTRMVDALDNKADRRVALMAGLALPEQSRPSIAVSFSAAVLSRWGRPMPAADLSFRDGMLKDAESLGDVRDGNEVPVDWTIATKEENSIGMLLIVGHSDEAELKRVADRWKAELAAGWTEILRDYGRRRTDDKEFFGFNDGVSQPAMRGLDPDGRPVSRRPIDETDPRSKQFARPGQRLIWPGNFIFGYEVETSDPLDPGPVAAPPEPWMRNGSYLVFRRLKQDVEGFRTAVAALETRLTALGETMPDGWLASRLVGRWPDGTPLQASPDRPDGTGKDVNRNTNFRFKTRLRETRVSNDDGTLTIVPEVPGDANGKILPFVGHIRKVNPRDGDSDIGTENNPRALMLRRGVTFGPEMEDDPQAERGLLFLSYQTSIVERFKFVQADWANDALRPSGGGPDPLIGQDGTPENARRITLFGPSGTSRTCPFDGRWVIPTGGEYLFAPGIEGLRELTEGAVLVASAEGEAAGNRVALAGDLSRIRGLGPILLGRLRDAGIHGVAQIAAWSAADAERYDAVIKARGRVARYEWVKQAQEIVDKA